MTTKAEELESLKKEFIGSRAAQVFSMYLNVAGNGGDYAERLKEAKVDLDVLLTAAKEEERERVKQILIRSLGIYLAFPSDKYKFDGVKVDKVWMDEVEQTSVLAPEVKP